MNAGTPEERVTRLSALHEDKSRIALDPQRLVLLDQFLRQRYGITHFDGRAQWEEAVEGAVDEATRDEYIRIVERRAEKYASGKVSEASDRLFYDAIAKDPLFGLTHSQKRAHILDTAALLTRVVEEAQVTGALLDVGCNGGYHASWLAEQTHVRRVVGVDSSAASIAYARAKVDAGAASDRITLTHALFPAKDAGSEFDLIVSAAGPISITDRQSLHGAAKLLSPGGVLVVIESQTDWKRGIDVAAKKGLGAVLLDVVGGWTVDGFLGHGVVVFVKGAQPMRVRDAEAEVYSAWADGFRDYANGPAPAQQKTQAFYRTRALEQRERAANVA